MPSLFRRIFKSNKFWQAFFMNVMSGTDLYKDQDLSTHIKDGYENNPTVFGSANKLASKAACVPLIPMRGDEVSKENPLKDLFKDNRTDYSLKEFRTHWHLFRLLLGESIVYAPKLIDGNNKGETTSLDIMPPQMIDIVTGGTEDPVKYFKVDGEDKIPINPVDVYHSRCFLNLDFTDGKNFRGISPLGVASNIILAINAGDKTIKDLYEAGMPPFMLVNKNIDETQIEEQKVLLEEAWRKKSKDIPLLGGGDVYKVDLGFSNIRDLMITETDSRGLRIMCNIWGVHVSLFSDEHATENNIGTARKLMYEDRVIPDIESEVEFYNSLFESKGITYKPDYSQIPALQEDKEKVAKIYGIGIDKKAVSKNEFREAVGLEPIEDPVMGEEGLIDDATFIPLVPGIDQERREDE